MSREPPPLAFASKWEQFVRDELFDCYEARDRGGTPGYKDCYERLYSCRRPPQHEPDDSKRNSGDTCGSSVEGAGKTKKNSNKPIINKFELTARAQRSSGSTRIYDEYMRRLEKKEEEERQRSNEKEIENKILETKRRLPKPWKLFKTAYESFMDTCEAAFEKFKTESRLDSPTNSTLPMLVEDVISPNNLENVLNSLQYVVKDTKEDRCTFLRLCELLQKLSECKEKDEKKVKNRNDASLSFESSDDSHGNKDVGSTQEDAQNEQKQDLSKKIHQVQNSNPISKTVFMKFMKALFRQKYNSKALHTTYLTKENKEKLYNYVRGVFSDLTQDYEDALYLFLSSTKFINVRVLGEYLANKEQENRRKTETVTLSKKKVNDLVDNLIRYADTVKISREKAKEEKDMMELACCTFKPVFQHQDSMRQKEGPKMTRDEFFRSLVNTKKKPITELKTEEKELLNCTFKPKISNKSLKPPNYSHSRVTHDYDLNDQSRGSYRVQGMSGNRYNINWDADDGDEKSGGVSITVENQDTFASMVQSQTYEDQSEPKGFRESINRVRLAKFRREQAEREMENIGRVDPTLLRKIKKIKDVNNSCTSANTSNADIYSSLSQQKPFKFRTEERAKNPKLTESQILLHIDIKVGNGKTGRISVRKGDTAKELAQEFSQIYALSNDVRDTLESVIQERMEENGIC